MAERKKSMVEAAGPAADKKRALETAMAQIERTYGKAALRCQLSGETDIKLTRADFGRASSDKEFSALKNLNTKRTARIGFGVSES